MADVDIDELRRRVIYDPHTGNFTYAYRTVDEFSAGAQSAEQNCAIWNGKWAGRPAFSSLHENGYLIGNICGRPTRAHRAAWAISYGAWPDTDIDHINRNRRDNRLANLRLVTRSENLRNKAAPVTNTSGIVGVSWAPRRQKWNARIGVNGFYKNLGYFDDLSCAAEARVKAELAYWGHRHFENTDENILKAVRA